MIKVLVTGGSGYLGGRIIEYFSLKGINRIIGITSKSIDQTRHNSNIEIINVSLLDEKSIIDVCKGVDVIIHTAGVNAGDSAKDPLFAFEFNLKGTLSICRAAQINNVSKVIYLSTAHVYDSPLRGTITEDTCAKSIHPYATSHKSAENIILSLPYNSQTKGIVIRLSNSFGSPVNASANCWQLLVNDLCVQGISSGKMVIKSNPNQKRDFVPISFFLKALEFIVDNENINYGNGIINIGGEWTPTLFEMAYKIKDRINIVLNKDVSIESSGSSYPTENFYYSIDKLKSFGFNLDPHSFISYELDSLINFCSIFFKK